MKFLRYYSIYCYYYYCSHYYYHRARRSEQTTLSAGSRGAGHDNQNNRESTSSDLDVYGTQGSSRASLTSNTPRRIISVYGKLNGRTSSWLSRPGQSSLFPPFALFSLLLSLFLSVCLPLPCLYFTLYSFAFLETFLVPASVRAPTTLSEFSPATCAYARNGTTRAVRVLPKSIGMVQHAKEPRRLRRRGSEERTVVRAAREC